MDIFLTMAMPTCGVQVFDSADVFVFDRDIERLIARREKSTPQQDYEFIRQFIQR